MIFIDGILDFAVKTILICLISDSIKVIVVDNDCAERDVIMLKDMLKDDGLAYPSNRNFDPHKTILLPYSSGTTGLPKGVMLTSDNIVSNICQQASPELKFVDQATGNIF